MKYGKIVNFFTLSTTIFCFVPYQQQDLLLRLFEKLFSGTELENCFNYNVHVFEAAIRLTRNGKRRKRSGNS